MIEVQLTDLLRSVILAEHPGLSASRSHVYPEVAPDDAAAPFIIYSRLSTRRLRDLAGPLGVATPTFRISAYAVGFLNARALADAIRIALDGYSGGDIEDIEVVNELNMSDLTTNPTLSRVVLDCQVRHLEGTSTPMAALALDFSDAENSGLLTLF